MPGSEFAPLAERIIDNLLASDPYLAGGAGDHRFDDRLPDLSADGVAAQVAMLRDAAAALSGVDTDSLDAVGRVDHQQLLGLVERMLFGLTEIREHEWNPLLHNPAPLLNEMAARPFAPPTTRLESLAARLAAVPDSLATARATLRDCPRIHLEAAAGQLQGAVSFVRKDVPALVREAPAMASIVEPTAAAAAASLAEFTGWLAGQATSNGGAGEGRDPRLGRRLWEAKLWHTLDTQLSASDVLRRAWDDLEQVTAQLREGAAALVGGRADDDTVRLALDQLSAEHPDGDSIVELAQQVLDETTAFVRAHDLVSIMDDPLVVREMPEFERGVAFAHCDAPGSLETAEVPTFFCIAPTPTDWPPERVKSFYREYNIHMMRNLTVHEAMPGHYLQLAHARRFSGPTRTRALTRSGTFVEGWAVYAEQVVVDHGFGGPAVRLQQLKLQLRSIINAIVDQLVHCEGMTEAEAMALMTGRGFQEEGEAAGKWRRALLTSTQLSTYFVGYTEVAAIGRSRPAGTSERSWHDAMLAHGSPSPRHLRTLLGC